MRINVKAKLEKLCSRDQSRPVMTHLYLRIIGEGEERRGYLEGTDSYKLGRVPVELEPGDTEGFVPVEVIKTARKLKTDSIRCNGTLEIIAGDTTLATFPRENIGQFPDVDRLMDLEPARIEGYAWKIGLSAKLLHELAEGLGTDGVSLEFTATKPAPDPDTGAVNFAPSNLRPIVVRPLTNHGAENADPDAIGLLMPLRVSG